MPENILFDSSIKKIEFTFRSMGINIKSGSRKNKDTLKSRCIYIINFIWLNTDLAGAIFWFISGLKGGKNLTELTYVAPCIILSFLGNLKTLVLIIYEKNVHQLIDNLRGMERKDNIRKNNKVTNEIVREERRFFNIVINMLNALNGALIVTFAISPLILMALHYFRTNEVEYILPFLIVYPFNAYDVKYWPVVYLRQIWSEVIVVVDICAADYLFYTFCTYLTIQFRLLQHNVEEILTTKKLFNRDTHDEEFRKKFIAIIKWHQDLILSVTLLETIYTKSTLYNFVSSSIIICLTGFNVTVNIIMIITSIQPFIYIFEKTILFYKTDLPLRSVSAIDDMILVVTFLSFLFMSLLQIFFLCFFGDMLMRSSMKVGDAVYNCKWYSASNNVGKHLLLVQTRAQKPCKLTASGFADVNLRAFTKILSSAWSYFALLQTLYSTHRE